MPSTPLFHLANQILYGFPFFVIADCFFACKGRFRYDGLSCNSLINAYTVSLFFLFFFDQYILILHLHMYLGILDILQSLTLEPLTCALKNRRILLHGIDFFSRSMHEQYLHSVLTCVIAGESSSTASTYASWNVQDFQTDILKSLYLNSNIADILTMPYLQKWFTQLCCFNSSNHAALFSFSLTADDSYNFTDIFRRILLRPHFLPYLL